MKYLKEYIEQEPIFSDLVYGELTDEDKTKISETLGFEMYRALVELNFSWNELKQSTFDSMDSKWQRFLLKIWFKIKGI
jgi:hypothetical protein